MPINKNALIRYRVLDRCFRNTGKRYYIDDLIRKCEEALPLDTTVSRRTIFNDINFMESDEGWGDKGIDVVRHKDGKRVYYRYANPDFSIDNSPLSQIEITQLEAAIDAIAQFKGMPQFEWVEDILCKLRSTTNNSNRQVIGFDSNPYLVGLEYLSTIYNAIVNKSVLRVKYKPFQADIAQEHIFHPYHLRQYNMRWYVFGADFSDEHIPIWHLALDRIKSVETMVKEKYIESDIDWSEYLSDVVGVTIPAGREIEEIVLHCYGKTAQYIITKPMHESQRQRQIDDNCWEVKLNVIPNFELVSQLLSRGEGLKVISPESLRKELLAIAQSITDLYKR